MAAKKVYIVIGLPKSGRTEVCKAISWALKVPRGHILTVGYLHLAGELACKTGGELSHCVRTVLGADKAEIQPRLEAAHATLYAQDPVIAIRTLFELGVQVVDGIETREELAVAKANLKEAGFEVETWWVKRPVEHEHAAPHENYPIEDDADGLIENDAATPAELQKSIIDFLTPASP